MEGKYQFTANEGKKIKAKNGVTLNIEYRSKVIEPGRKYTVNAGEPFAISGASYPSITELCHQSDEKNNGKLIVTCSAPACEGDRSTSACVMMSADGGRTWECIARPHETLRPDLRNVGSMAHIYELPAQVGDMPAGTLLYSYNSVIYGTMEDRKSGDCILAVWRSFDCGYTWEEYVIIDEGGGIREGVWEPFMTYCEEDGYLYCVYSDDSDPDHDQKISYKRSKDGVNWEGENGKSGTGNGTDVEPVDMVAIEEFEYRPGMPVITKMGNGEYFMIYEQFGTTWKGCPLYYRTTKDLANWGEANYDGVRVVTDDGRIAHSSPSCLWVPAGGECGTLLVTGKSASNNGFIFASFDYGKTWEGIEDPIGSRHTDTIGKRLGYSSGLWLGRDKKTVYYVSSTNSDCDPDNKQMIAFAKLTID